MIRAWHDRTGGLTVYDGYGQTETTCLVANYRSMEVRPGSMGRPVPGYDVTVVDDDGQPVERGEVGNIVVRCQPDRPVGLFPGYYQDPDASAAAFRGPFYFTGDKAAMDEDGYFWFEGRDDDVITSSAYRIGPVRGRECARRAPGGDGSGRRRPRRTPTARRSLPPSASSLPDT